MKEPPTAYKPGFAYWWDLSESVVTATNYDCSHHLNFEKKVAILSPAQVQIIFFRIFSKSLLCVLSTKSANQPIFETITTRRPCICSKSISTFNFQHAVSTTSKSIFQLELQTWAHFEWTRGIKLVMICIMCICRAQLQKLLKLYRNDMQLILVGRPTSAGRGGLDFESATKISKSI